MTKVDWKVDGMTCTTCALTINKALEKKGFNQIIVDPIQGIVSFETDKANAEEAVQDARKQVEALGYSVNKGDQENGGEAKREIAPYMLRFWVSLPFTILLMLHMVPGLHWHWLMNPWVQLALAIPVFLIGLEYFGKSTLRSLRNGILNMDVLVLIGSSAAFGYSLYGLFTNKPQDFLFFETAASIITIVLFGNYLEHVSIAKTKAAITRLTKKQVIMANVIAYDSEGNENIFPVENTALRVGDLVLIKTGEQIPADCKALSGEAEVNEALLTGESAPIFKQSGDLLVGGSTISTGMIKAYVTAVGDDTVMSGIVSMMKKAQSEKPPVQKLADRISEIFIPAVLVIALLTLIGNLTFGGHAFKESLLRSIAVLVIACPCAMGLATPAAIAVGLGRAAKSGILFTDVSRMELFRTIRQMVFDKTGTLTTGKFVVKAYSHQLQDDDSFKKIVFSIEKFSNHPIAKSIASSFKSKGAIVFEKVEERKGLGMYAKERNGTEWMIGSPKILFKVPDEQHQIYVTKNGELAGWLDIEDEIRPEAKDVIAYCKTNNIKTILLSGDSITKCNAVASYLGIDEVIAEKSPEQKLEIIEKLVQQHPTAMVGDGINDAPALAKATISISLSEASQLAIQSASVVLTGGGLQQLPKAMQLGQLTYGTVKSNLFWAFAYNVVAIPVAALGYLHPSIGALIMGGSDVVLALNSLWLGVRKLK